MIAWLDSITDSMDMNLSKLRELVKDREAWPGTVHGVTKKAIDYIETPFYSYRCSYKTGSQLDLVFKL